MRFGGGQGVCAFVQTACRAVAGQGFEDGFGAQDEHPQAFAQGFDEVCRSQQQQVFAAVEHQHVGDDAAFGRVVGGIAGFSFGQSFDVVGQLAVQEGGAVFAADADQAEKGQGGSVHGESSAVFQVWYGKRGGLAVWKAV